MSKSLIVIVLLFSFVYNTYEKAILHGCKDPSELQLKYILTEAFKDDLIEELSHGVGYYPNKHFSKELVISGESRIVNRTIHGHKTCDLIQQTEWPINRNTLCPHHFVEERREDRYPFTRFRAVCNCQKCVGLPNTHVLTYCCQPITIYKPVLTRGECQLNGVYKWSLRFESVAISCGCNIPAKIS